MRQLDNNPCASRMVCWNCFWIHSYIWPRSHDGSIHSYIAQCCMLRYIYDSTQCYPSDLTDMCCYRKLHTSYPICLASMIHIYRWRRMPYIHRKDIRYHTAVQNIHPHNRSKKHQSLVNRHYPCTCHMVMYIHRPRNHSCILDM